MEVIIIGAGMTGLSAALALKSRNIPYILLEAQDAVGGRARTAQLPSGTAVDLGAHWLHGDDNPLRKLVRHYGLPHVEDKGRSMFAFKDGRREEIAEDWLEKATNPDKAKKIEKGAAPDEPITALAKDPDGARILRDFATMWNGIDPPVEPSAREFLTDKSKPGGLQLTGGMASLIDRMAEDAGWKNIRTNTPVAAIAADGEVMRVTVGGGDVLTARKVIFTGALPVLKSGNIAFSPPLTDSFRSHLDGQFSGEMNKIIIEMPAGFFAARGIPRDMACQLLDGDPPHFCHLHSGGSPLITLFVSGQREARRAEAMTPAQALAHAAQILSPIGELTGFENAVVGAPIVTKWVGNPFIQGAYSGCLAGATRTGPWLHGNLCFCGDALNELYPASLAGAYLSGAKAAELVAG